MAVEQVMTRTVFTDECLLRDGYITITDTDTDTVYKVRGDDAYDLIDAMNKAVEAGEQ